VRAKVTSVPCLVSIVVAVLTLVPGAPLQGAALGICTGTWASVHISYLHYDCFADELQANGQWWVGGGANGVRLKYFIDGQLYQNETKSGTDGTWRFADDFDALCRSHTFQVVAIARVGSTDCLEHDDADSAGFPSLPSASMDCSGGHPQYYCVGTVSGGEPLYTAEWKEGGYGWVPAYPTSPSSGPWSRSFVCKSSVLIRFRVTDACSCTSNPAADLCGSLEP
jgi:hypothetical protein